MSFVRSWVYRNAFCSKGFAIQGSLQYIRSVSPAGIAQSCEFVDIDT